VSEQPHRTLSRANLHRGDSASWSEGGRVLGLFAGLGVDPVEVYVPPEPTWRAGAPAWARDFRERVIRDFEALGVRVVVLPNAALYEIPPPAPPGS
jgi:hypothetical protein